jgi:hypothetical protein
MMRVEPRSPQASQACQVTYSSGTLYMATQFCVTVNANIPLFALRDTRLFQQAGNPADFEGYRFCDITAVQRYNDCATYDNRPWDASTLRQNGYASNAISRCLPQDSRPGWIRCSPFL